MKLLRALGMAATFLLLLACGNSSLSPRPVPLDKVNCAGCGMMISEERFAAELVSASGDVRYYDDLGCLAADSKIPSSRHRAYVRGDTGQKWLDAQSAFFARPARLQTPMAYGFAAFASAQEARANDAAGGVFTWDEVRRNASHDGSKK